jgi:hypothetical protein
MATQRLIHADVGRNYRIPDINGNHMEEIDFYRLKEIDEFQSILDLFSESKKYLESFNWCKKIIKGWYDFGFFEKLGVFLFNIESNGQDVDDFIWVIVGDLPTAYIDSSVKTGLGALRIYCDLMEEWAVNVSKGKSVDECFPVPVEQTRKNAELLMKRINFLKENYLKDT